MEIKDFVGDADIKNEADLLMDMLNNVSIITFLNLIVRLIQTEKVVIRKFWLLLYLKNRLLKSKNWEVSMETSLWHYLWSWNLL